MAKKMSLDDFRAVRTVLEPDDYALSSAEPEPSPSDLVPEETWRHLTILPDEAAVRTSNRHGALLNILNRLAGTWPESVGDAEQADLIGLSMIEVINEHEATLFNMLVGFYRQAVDSLRIVFESVSIGAYCHLTAQSAILQGWLDGATSVPFDTAASGLQSAPQSKLLHEHLTRELGVGFADQARRGQGYSGGWMRQLYGTLSKYSHGRPLFNNTSLWQSNGPIYVGRAVAIVSGLFIETLVASYVLAKLCRPEFELPADAREILETAALGLPEWAQVSDAARQAYTFVFGGALHLDM